VSYGFCQVNGVKAFFCFFFLRKKEGASRGGERQELNRNQEIKQI
jgi:hypothetical protein